MATRLRLFARRCWRQLSVGLMSWSTALPFALFCWLQQRCCRPASTSLLSLCALPVELVSHVVVAGGAIIVVGGVVVARGRAVRLLLLLLSSRSTVCSAGDVVGVPGVVVAVVVKCVSVVLLAVALVLLSPQQLPPAFVLLLHSLLSHHSE